jgi:hypothetical protein
MEMNVMKIVESVLTYFLTAGFVATVTYFFHLSKRVTILEEHDKEQVKAVDKISNLTEKLTRIDTKLDLLLDGKLKGGVS